MSFPNLEFLCDRIVGDNVDLEVQARIQTKEHRNKSIHWTHQFAEVGRAQNPMLDSTKPQKQVGDLQLIELLPSKDVQARFQKTWAVLISRVICKYLASFHQYRSLVIHHIPHQFSEEMSQKSKSVSGYKFFIIILVLSSFIESEFSERDEFT